MRNVKTRQNVFCTFKINHFYFTYRHIVLFYFKTKFSPFTASKYENYKWTFTKDLYLNYGYKIVFGNWVGRAFEHFRAMTLHRPNYFGRSVQRSHTKMLYIQLPYMDEFTQYYRLHHFSVLCCWNSRQESLHMFVNSLPRHFLNPHLF